MGLWLPMPPCTGPDTRYYSSGHEIPASRRADVAPCCLHVRCSPAWQCGRLSSAQHYRRSFLSSCDCCSLFCSPRQLELRQVRHCLSLCRVCFDLAADGEGQPEPAEQKRLCTSSRRPGNCTHLPSITLGMAGSVAGPNALYAISFMERA